MTPEKKAELLRSLFDLEDESVGRILELGQMNEAELLAESNRLHNQERHRIDAWGRRRCKCGKLNRDCGELTHQIETIDPLPPTLLRCAKTVSPKGTIHEWVIDALKRDEV